MTGDNQENISEDAGTLQTLADIPKQEATQQEGASHTTNNINSRANVQNNGNVNTQNINVGEETLNIKSLLTDFDISKIKKVVWEKLNGGDDNIDYQANLNRLIEDHIIFISADNFKDSWSLAYNISCNDLLKGYEKKQVFFGHAKKEIVFGFMELVQKMNECENLFIISDLTIYNVITCQRTFLESLTKQLHHDSLKFIRDKKIYLVVLVTDKIRQKIELGIDGYERHFHVWSINNEGLGKAPDIEEVLKNANSIQKVLLYTATFFNGVSFRSFDAIVKLLLTGSVNNVPIAMEVYKDFDDGARKILKVIDDENVKIYEAHKDKFLSECQLIGKEEAGLYIVDFSHPELLEICRCYFKRKEHFFWQEQFHIIERSGLLFNRNNHIAERVIDIILEAIQDDPDYYDDEWFWLLAMDIRDFENQKLTIEGSTLQEQVIQMWEIIRHRNDAYFFYNRFGQVLAQMLTKGMGDRVKTFLEQLNKDHDVLFKLTQRLAHLEVFDKFYWIKKLLDTGIFEIKNITYYWLLNKVSYYDRERTWQTIISWLPKDKQLTRYSPSNHYACLFIIHFYVNESIMLPISGHGQWPSLYPLFAGYVEDPEKCKVHIRFVLQQAFHEGTQHQFSSATPTKLYWVSQELFCLNYATDKLIRNIMGIDKVDADQLQIDFTPTYQSLLADLIETWFHILHGYEGPMHKDAESLCDFLIGTVIGEWRNKEVDLNKIIQHWNTKHGFYQRQLNKISAYQSEDHANELNEDDNELIQLYIESIRKREEGLMRFLEQLMIHLK